MQFEKSEMLPQLAAKLANGPVQAENEALRDYQMQLMLLEQQRQSLQAIKRSAGNRTEQNMPGPFQGPSNSQPLFAARQTALGQSSGAFVSTNVDSGVKGTGKLHETEEEEDGKSVDGIEEDEEEEEGDEDYCTCRGVRYGNMVKCRNGDCPYEWFHLGCVGITKKPSGPWFCEECRSRT
jgi:inhibitor of growth protein 3